MKTITHWFSSTGFLYSLLAVSVTAVMVFAVLPQFPQVGSTLDKVGFAAPSALAIAPGGSSGGCCGGGSTSSGGPGDGSSGGYSFPPAKCDFLNANKTKVPHGGGNVTLSWGTTNAFHVAISGIGQVAADGSRTVRVNSDTTFVLTASGWSPTTDTCRVTVKVDEPPKKPAKCDFFNANRNSVPHGGANVRLSWGTTNSNNVTINNGIGRVAADGSRTVFVDDTTTFTLTARSADGNDNCTVKIVEEPPKKHAAKCDFFTASDTHLPDGGDHVTLSWGTTNATSVSINNGVGSVPDDGSETVFVDDTTTFTLTARGTGGNDNCTVKITVDDKPDKKPARCDFFTVSDDEVEEGDEVTLEWGTTNATDVEINQGIGDVPDDGSERVEINRDTTFVLTARGTDGDDTCSVRVEVEEEDDDDDEPRPRCELDISDDKVKVGEEVTLEWEVEHADEVTIEDDDGDRIFRDDDLDADDEEDGEVDVVITEDTEFTLEAEGPGGRRECDVDVEVEDEDVLVLSERDQGKVAGISLTQVPYTGFEAGPALTFFFYALLTAWALVVAYMLVIRKDTILGFSLAGATHATRSRNETPYEHLTEATEEYTESVAAPAPAVPVNLPTGTPVIGYASYNEAEEEAIETDEMQVMKELEDYAHSRNVLLSSDALRYIESHAAGDTFTALDTVIDEAKATYPSEDGWVVLNLDRVAGIMTAEDEPVAAPTETEATGAGSLAEAIVTGNIAAAYQLIEHRPMIALADAAAELDAVYRMYQGNPTGTILVSDLLKAEVAKHSLEDLKAAIDALTGALDGTYTDEASAVKMAIMKAIKAFAG